MAKICVFLASADPHNDAVADSIRYIANDIFHNGHHLVMGGMATGCMKLLGDTFLACGGRATIIYPVEYAEFSGTCKHPDVDHVTTANVNARLDKMIELADAFITFPGGIGTFHEFWTITADDQACLYHTGGFRKLKPMVLYNPENFFRGTLIQIADAAASNYIKAAHLPLIQPEEDLYRVLPHLEGMFDFPYAQWP